jgi:tight adherence protein C
MPGLTLGLIILLTFGAITAFVFVAAQYLLTQMQLQRRAASTTSGIENGSPIIAGIDDLVLSFFDEKKFGIRGEVRAKLRRDLVRAGFFRPVAVNYYIFSKLLVVVVVPLTGYVLTELFLPGYSSLMKLLIVAVFTGLAILAPDAYISRRQSNLTAQHRDIFPDLLDLMVVCVDAGLSLEAAIMRLSKEMLKRSRAMGMNLLLLEAEIRAGRTSADSLQAFAERIGLDEARSFVATLRQSMELGTNVGDALRVFSDEMRGRRMMRAEERANKLPVKMVLPMGAFIFPVILMTVMLPAILRLVSVTNIMR